MRLTIIPEQHDPGIQRGQNMGKRGLKAGTLTIKQWKARNRHRHNGGTNKSNKSVTYWRLGYWMGGPINRG